MRATTSRIAGLIASLTIGVASAASAEDAGRRIYEAHCAGCHAPANIMVASPKLHRARDWEPRLAQGFDVVLGHALQGYNAMPPRGACDSCSDAEIAAAIRYMSGAPD